jgi:hypothetical protein
MFGNDHRYLRLSHTLTEQGFQLLLISCHFGLEILQIFVVGLGLLK